MDEATNKFTVIIMVCSVGPSATSMPCFLPALKMPVTIHELFNLLKVMTTQTTEI